MRRFIATILFWISVPFLVIGFFGLWLIEKIDNNYSEYFFNKF